MVVEVELVKGGGRARHLLRRRSSGWRRLSRLAGSDLTPSSLTLTTTRAQTTTTRARAAFTAWWVVPRTVVEGPVPMAGAASSLPPYSSISGGKKSSLLKVSTNSTVQSRIDTSVTLTAARSCTSSLSTVISSLPDFRGAPLDDEVDCGETTYSTSTLKKT